jgi:hypothetical protein
MTGPRRRERKGDARGNGSVTGEPGPRDRERGSARVKKTGADRSAQLGSEREREGARGGTTADRRGPPVRRRGRAGARPRWVELGRLGCISFFFFTGFSNSFSISFL